MKFKQDGGCVGGEKVITEVCTQLAGKMVQPATHAHPATAEKTGGRALLLHHPIPSELESHLLCPWNPSRLNLLLHGNSMETLPQLLFRKCNCPFLLLDSYIKVKWLHKCHQ
ncbi:hypothetical protein AMECASPLE_039083 [Ameca splendens]|uniref:Uncharacterized protein n=1 Tax=Ameca splendens TaxID=208324 RepID=A0ABV0YK11_9TELE